MTPLGRDRSTLGWMREHLTFANVMSCVAVFIALGGTAMAIKANSVGSRHVKNDSLRGVDVKDGSLKGKDLAELTLTGREIDPRRFPLGALTGLVSGRSPSMCAPEDLAFEGCAADQFSIPQTSRVLAVVAGSQRGPAGSAGECKIRIGTKTFFNSSAIASGDPDERDGFRPNGFAFTVTSGPQETIPPGPTQVTVLCNRTAGAPEFDVTFSVLALASRRS